MPSDGSIEIRPSKNHILVKRTSVEETVGGTSFVLPKDFHSKPMKCVVVDVGEEPLDTSMDISVGDEVLLPKYGSTKVMRENEEYHLCHINDIIGVI